MPLTSYVVTSSAGLVNTWFFGEDIVTGHPISNSTLKVGDVFFADPHGGSDMYRLWLATNTAVAAGTGSIKPGSVTQFGRQTRYFNTGLGLPGAENQ